MGTPEQNEPNTDPTPTPAPEPAPEPAPAPGVDLTELPGADMPPAHGRADGQYIGLSR